MSQLILTGIADSLTVSFNFISGSIFTIPVAYCGIHCQTHARCCDQNPNHQNNFSEFLFHNDIIPHSLYILESFSVLLNIKKTRMM